MSQAPAQEPPIAPVSVKEIGAQMAALRAQFSLTQQEVSERLHIRARYVAAMEAGRLEELPGKAYARGYLHSYAEFLGLDAPAIVAQCFATEGAVAHAVAHRAPPAVRPSLALDVGRFRGAAIAFAALLVLALIASQWINVAREPVAEEPSVAAVPEDMLADLRTRVMPTPRNLDCLTRDSIAMCLATDGVARDLAALAAAMTVVPYGDPIDVSGIELAPLEEAPAEENAAEIAAPAEPVEEVPND